MRVNVLLPPTRGGRIKLEGAGLGELQPRRTAVGAWVVYDIANTIFWTGLVGITFPLWIKGGTDDTPPGLSGDDATLAYTLAGTMAVVLLLAPILGAISDHATRRMPMLFVLTLAAVCATLALGTGGLLFSLGIFALALCTMELGTIFYNGLLAEVSTEAFTSSPGGAYTATVYRLSAAGVPSGEKGN